MAKKKYIVILSVLAIVLSIMYLFIWVYTQRKLIGGNYNPNMFSVYLELVGRRAIQLGAILIAVILIATSALVFQTITNNRILTPSVLGFDAIFLVTQTLIIGFLGISSIFVSNEYLNFFTGSLAMIGIVILMYNVVLKKNKNNIVLLLLMGLVITSLARSITNFIQVFMNPEEFQSVTGLTTISLTNINTGLVLLTLPIMVTLIVLFYKESNTYDVMNLGEDQAVNLGVDYNKKTKLTLIYVAISVAIATSLIGPLSFLGLIAVNGAREIFKTNKHKTLMALASLFGFVILMLGQVIVELIDNKTSVSVLISLIGGGYMIYLIIKENKV